MIVRKIIDQKLKEFEINEYIRTSLRKVGLSSIKLQMTPLGEKIIINASRPGLIVGRKGQSIRKLTLALKNKFKLENPQIEINEIEKIGLDPNIIAEKIANSLEKFGPMRFKSIGHKSLEEVMRAGALGVEILISGKIPSSRAKRWRFYQGYLKKCGDVALTGVKTAYSVAQIKSGTVGIQVRILPPEVILPDQIKIYSEHPGSLVEESTENVVVESTEKADEKTDKKKTDKKKSGKKDDSKQTKSKKRKVSKSTKTKTEKTTEEPSSKEEKSDDKDTKVTEKVVEDVATENVDAKNDESNNSK
ncbi:30S ribosomal protein S3 [Candidatus Woesearchaeota archaeon]|jgi:small subunit ribosomal protein S3|nr:30S ribosomal protein S3 [Candidatus Woesearchaeota archaeon]MBT5271925.1 30S ribosomal protein S3 [Candidatus Woesearchaeota archaeon]MBT6041037.1 30S ribosomal protein S3 [Candidatus Woesearchaeota archaeon]MBT6336213.1 30S ribosomal protein S3 [Candidatus Woesearchaeota archaeon]MBT7928020.1 30S ribosomal protein S3 [Candidatus Woesearchaeota archaeon]